MSGYPQHPQQFPQQFPPQPGTPQGSHPQMYPPGNPFSDQAPNPYAAPQQAAYSQQAAPQKPSAYPGLWRQGNILVMHKMAPLPDICLKSNQPANRRLKRNLSWHHPAIALTILVGVLIYVILAMILTKRATIYVPLTEEWYARRQRRMLFAWGVGLVCIGLMVGGIVLAVQTEQAEYIILLLVGFLAGLFTLVFGQMAVGLVAPKRMTDEYIWLKGVHVEFLNRLDYWPYNI
jgi:hypothetical protein